MYLPMRTIHRNKGDPAKLPGVWSGIDERTEEVLVGTMDGVTTCRTVNRISGDRCWDYNLVNGMRGVPWEVVPGTPNIPIPAEIKNNGMIADGDEPMEEVQIQFDGEEMQEAKFRGGFC